MNPTEHSEQWVALNADVVGYSALVADDVEATSAAMSAARRIVESTVVENGGTLANFVGDSFMAVFHDAMDGLRSAISISRAVEGLNAGLPDRRQLRFRMGMDLGEVTFAEGNHHGDALNIAARIQAIARPGGLAVSGRVYQALDEPALRFRAMGRRSLKNIPERVGVFEFVDLPSDAKPRRDAGLSLEAPTLAALPIHTEGVDDTVRPMAGMLRHDLLHRLSAIPDLRVVDAPDEPGRGDGANARYMLETGVHQFGDTVRVFAVLFDLTTMNVVKSHKWTIPVAELFSLSDKVADEVARSVEVDLVVGEPAHFYNELDDPDAIEKIYLGWYHLRSDTAEGWRRARDLFLEVAASHPHHPYGYVLAAFALWLGAANGWAQDTEEALSGALELARRGAAADDPTGMAQAVEAAVRMSQGEAAEALEILDGLQIVRPTCDITYGLEGSVRRYLGQWEKAVELVDTAMRLTGINKPWYPTVKACSLFLGNQLEDAAWLAESVLEYQPHNLEALLVLAGAQAELGLERRSRATAELVKERFPATDIEGWLDKSPYKRREMVERWKGALASAGAIGAKHP